MRTRWIPATVLMVMSFVLASAWAQQGPDRPPRGRGEARGPRGDRPGGPALDGGLKLFEMLDADGDGVISREEFQAGLAAGGRRMRNRDRERDDTEDRPGRPTRDRARLGRPDTTADTPPAAGPRQRMRERDRDRREDRSERPGEPRGRLGRAIGEQPPPIAARMEQRIRAIVREELARLRTPDSKGAAFSPTRGGPRWNTGRGWMGADRPGPRDGRSGQGRGPRGGRIGRPTGYMRSDVDKDGRPQGDAIRQAVRMLERALDSMEGGRLSLQDRRGPAEGGRRQLRMGGPQRRSGAGPRGGFPREGYRGGPWR